MKKENDIVDQIADIARALDCNFTVKGESIAMEKVFSRSGLLPAIMRRADQLCSFCMGYGLGLTFDRSDDAMLGVLVEFDDNVPNALRLLCAADVIIELVQMGPSHDVTPLDDLMAEK